jgi:fatty-acyl-CoA synthase
MKRPADGNHAAPGGIDPDTGGHVNLVRMLAARALKNPAGACLIVSDEEHSYRSVWEGAMRVRAGLLGISVSSEDRICIALDNGPEFFHCFFGVLMAGCIPVPVSPKSSPERLRHIGRDCQARLAILEEPKPLRGKPSGEEAAEEPLFREIWRKPRLRELPAGYQSSGIPDLPPTAIAFLQYTSGSTGASKGVIMTHAAVLANIDGFMERMGVGIGGQGEVFSSMLPLYHDMGLIGFGLGAIHAGVPLVLYHQEAFSLHSWLSGIKQHGVTITGGPNLFLHLANKHLGASPHIDLSPLRMLVCGSEPIHANVVEEFETRFGAKGKVKPAYGMAEVGLCATLTGPAEGFKVDKKGAVSCGKALANTEIAILTDQGMTRAPGRTGEVLIKSPSAMVGYHGRPESRTACFLEGYVRSGDEGYLDAEGDLFILGRIKNLIIRGGEKYAPQDIERFANAREGIAMSGAVGVPPLAGEKGGNYDERLCLVLEASRKLLEDSAAMEAVASAIGRDSFANSGIRPDVCFFVPANTLPFTVNGKLRHQALREMILSGSLPVRFEFKPEAERPVRKSMQGSAP